MHFKHIQNDWTARITVRETHRKTRHFKLDLRCRALWSNVKHKGWNLRDLESYDASKPSDALGAFDLAAAPIGAPENGRVCVVHLSQCKSQCSLVSLLCSFGVALLAGMLDGVMAKGSTWHAGARFQTHFGCCLQLAICAQHCGPWSGQRTCSNREEDARKWRFTSHGDAATWGRAYYLLVAGLQVRVGRYPSSKRRSLVDLRWSEDIWSSMGPWLFNVV